MKSFVQLSRIAFCLLILFCAIVRSALGQNGTWINPAGGSWSDPANWLNGIIAKGAGSTADFTTIDVPAGTITVTADFDPQTSLPFVIGNLLFGDTDPTNGVGNWILADGGGGLTLDSLTTSNSIIQVNLAQGSISNLNTGWGTATIQAVLNGTNTLVKAGGNRLILDPASANTYSGGTLISNGIVQLGISGNPLPRNSNPLALGTGPVIFRGGALRQQSAAIPGDNNPNNTPTEGTMPNSLIAETGQTGTIYFSPRAFPVLNGSVTGGGTLNVFVDFVRDDWGGNWSGFTGRINVAATVRGNGDLRFANTFVTPGGLSNAVMRLTTNGINGNTISMYNNGTSGNVVILGELSSTVPNLVNIIANSTGAGAGNSLPFVLQVGGLSTDATFGGNFSAPGVANGVGVIKEGIGTWILNGQTIENNGMMVVSNGVLQIGSDTSGKLGRTPVVTNYATLAFGRSDTLVVTNVIDGPGILQQRGAGTLMLLPSTGSNSYTGKTLVTNGVLLVASEAALGPVPAALTPDQLTLNGGGLRSTNILILSAGNRGVTLGSAGGTLSPDTNTVLSIGSTITGNGSLTINGSGMTALSAANTYSGKTVLKAGVVSLGSEAAFGLNPAALVADQLTFDGGAVEPIVNFSMSISGNTRGVTVATGGGELRIQTGTLLTLSSPMAGSGTLAKTGGGTVILNSTGTYSGMLAVNQGKLSIGASGALPGTATVNVASGATLDTSAAGLSLASGQTVAGNGIVLGNLTAGTGSTLSAGASVGSLAVTGNLTFNGATNTVEISAGTNDLIVVNGNLTLSGSSTIKLQPLSALPAGTYPLIKYTGTLSGGLGNLVLAGFPASRVTGALAINATTKSIDLVVTGSSSALVWTGGQAGNAWDVNTTANWLFNGVPDKFFDGDSVSFTEVGSTNPSVNLVAAVSAIASVNSSTDYTFGGTGKLTGLSSLTKSGAGKLTVLTTNDNTGGTTVSAGTVQVGNGIASGSLGSGPLVDNASLVFNLPGSRMVSSAISGTGTVTVQAGTLILSGTNSYGGTTINNGSILQVGSGGPSGSLGTGGVSDHGLLVFQRTGTLTNSSAISGTGSLAVQSGIVVLTANNTYSGTTTVDAGTLQVGAGGVVGTLGSAALVTVTNNGTLSFNRSDLLTNSTVITGPGILRQQGSGMLTIVSSNSYASTLIDAGSVLQISDGGINRYVEIVSTNADSTFTTNAVGSVYLGTGAITNQGQLIVNQSYPSTLDRLITGAGNLIHKGAGALTIRRDTANTYTGGTTITNATLIQAIPAGLTGQARIDALNGAVLGLGSGPVIFQGTNASLRLILAEITDLDGGYTPSFVNPINVAAGQTGALETPGRYTLSSPLSGSGTFNLGVQHVRGDVTGVWTNFFGRINIVSNSININNPARDFRWANNQGMPNARLYLAAPVTMYSRGTANQIIPIGALSGEAGSSLRSTSGGGTSAGVNETWLVGGANADATFDGTLLDANSFVKQGTGKWTLTGANTYTGSTTVSNGVLALSTNTLGIDGSIATSGLITVAGAGVLDVTALTDGTLHLGELAIQTNRGTGMVRGNLLVGPSGTLAPGFRIGTLTVTSNVTVQGTLELEFNTTNSPNSDLLVAPVITADSTFGSDTLNIINLGDEPTAWAKFKLTSVPVTGAFAITNLPVLSNPDLYWSNRLSVDGTLVVASLTLPQPPSTSTTPTNIVFARTGSTLTLSWPDSHIGWQLRVQTNNLAQGISTNPADWTPVANSTTTNRVSVPIDSARPSQFYRLVLP